jgi:hypothetical protein
MSKELGCELFWCPEHSLWFRYDEKEDAYRPSVEAFDLQMKSMMAQMPLPPQLLPRMQLPQNLLPGGQLPAGQFPGGQLPAGQLPAGQLPGGQLPAGGLPGGQLPAGQFPLQSSVMPVLPNVLVVPVPTLGVDPTLWAKLLGVASPLPAGMQIVGAPQMGLNLQLQQQMNAMQLQLNQQMLLMQQQLQTTLPPGFAPQGLPAAPGGFAPAPGGLLPSPFGTQPGLPMTPAPFGTQPVQPMAPVNP